MKPLQNDSLIPLYHQLKEILKDSNDMGYGGKEIKYLLGIN
ncbi:hypothetical protein [Bacillus sp. EB106-08-02-XG196]|jgi:hypothetical protein|nr:hypothetical protein [Bacillus sp. EB106-08-02-XG196]